MTVSVFFLVLAGVVAFASIDRRIAYLIILLLVLWAAFCAVYGQ